MTVLPAGVGLPCFVSQVVAVPGGSDCRFRLALRGGGIEAARLVAYVWDEDNAAREIAEADVTLPAGQWRQAELTFAVPADERQVGLWVYAVPSKPGRLWLDAAALSAVDRK